MYPHRIIFYKNLENENEIGTNYHYEKVENLWANLLE
jgi:hypothetical protein